MANANQPVLLAEVRRGRRALPGARLAFVDAPAALSVRNGVFGRYRSVRSEKCRAPERMRSTEKNEWNQARMPLTGFASRTCEASARVRAAWCRSARVT